MLQKIFEINGQMFYLYGKIGFEGDIMTLEYANDEGNIMKISDLKKYLAYNEDISNIGQPIAEDVVEFL